MQVDLTLRDASGACRDLAVSAPEGSTLAQLWPALHPWLPPDAVPESLWSGCRRLPADAVLGCPGLSSADIVHVGGRHERDPVRGAVLHLDVVGGPDAGSTLALSPGVLTVGRGPGCGLRLTDPGASREHAAVTVAAGRISVRDLGSTNATLREGQPIGAGEVGIQPDELLRLGESSMAVTDAGQRPAAVRAGPDGTRWVNRSPRKRPDGPADEVDVPVPADNTRPQRVQWIAALVPAAAGLTLAVLMHMPQFLLFALLSPLMLLGTALGDRVHWRRSRRRDAATYRRRLAAAQETITAELAAETRRRRRSDADPAALLRIATAPGSRLWERGRDDPDLLRVRFGLADRPSSLLARRGTEVAPAGALHAVPITADLRAGPLGVAAPDEIGAGVARWLLGQLGALVSPADLEFAVLLSDDVSPRWTWLRWLPHVRGRVATTAGAREQLVAALGRELEHRLAAGHHGRGSWPGPWLVVLIDRAGALNELPGLAQLLRRGAEAGMTALCVDEQDSRLPSACVTLARAGGETGTCLQLSERHRGETGEVVADRVDPQWADDLARSLSPLRDPGSDAAATIPEQCSLLEVLGLDDLDPQSLLSRWKRGGTTPRTVLGLGADGRVDVDLARDGPHALIAGTTGSGKSELLQSLVAGLAVTHPPERISFVLIDYKGGAAFADCARLPHTAGLVTDLDPQLTGRALQSLDCELRRREELFARAGAKDLDDYHSAVDEPLARLVLVVDEFAALAEELPDFVTGLIGIAQRGRSLGVHLVLATQRPNGVVSAEIRANAALRIALRTTDPGESAEVIDGPWAAAIEPWQPGRAYIRAGTTTTLVQTARVGGARREEPGAITVSPLDEWRRVRPGPESRLAGDRATDLAALVDALHNAAARSGRAAARRPWLAPLPELLRATDLDTSEHAGTVPIGRLDCPASQTQPELTVDLVAAGSLLFAGGPRSGRSSALVNLALIAAGQLGPDELHIYGIDCRGGGLRPLAALTHCPTLADADEFDTAATLLEHLHGEVLRRRAVLTELGADSIVETRRTNHTLPLILCVIDGWEELVAASEDYDGARSAELLVSLLRSAPAAGLTVALAGDRATLSPRLASAVNTKLLLRLTDRADFGLAGVPARSVPVSMPAGRAVRGDDAVEVQLAFAGNEPSRGEQERIAAELAAHWPKRAGRSRVPAHGGQLAGAPIVVRALPHGVERHSLPPAPAGRVLLGLGGDAGEPLTADLLAGAQRLLVAGPPRSGRTNVLSSILLQSPLGGPVIVAAPPRSPLVALAHDRGLRVITPNCAAAEAGDPPAGGLLLVDDCEAFLDTPAGDTLTGWVRAGHHEFAAVVSGRSDELAVTYRGVGAEVRRSHCGVLLHPSAVDGELLGVRLPRRRGAQPLGRGVLVGDPAWGSPFDGGPLNLQVALA